MIKRGVLLAASHKREIGQIGEDGPGAILSIEPEQGARLWKLVGREIPTNGRKRLSQFLPVLSIVAVSKTAEPVVTVGLTDDRARPYHLPTLAAPVARRTDLIQPAKGWRQVVALG